MFFGEIGRLYRLSFVSDSERISDVLVFECLHKSRNEHGIKANRRIMEAASA
jgi:hypothetical protein